MDSRVMNEEIFGPVLPMVEYDNLDEPIERINSKNPPLAVYIFSRKQKNIDRITEETESGATVINETTISFSHTGLPFGGFGQSGIGRAHGYSGFRAFSNEKAYFRQRIGFTLAKMFYPPYNNLKRKLVQLVVKFLA